MVKKIKMASWDCELAKNKSITFCGMIQIVDTRFFFLSDKEMYVVTFHRRAPFRVIDESYQGSCPYPFPKSPRSVAWKLWNTPFIESLNSDGLLFHQKPEERQFQYLIVTDDEWVEFISEPVEVKVIKGKDVFQMIKLFTTNDLKTLGKLSVAKY